MEYTHGYVALCMEYTHGYVALYMEYTHGYVRMETARLNQSMATLLTWTSLILFHRKKSCSGGTRIHDILLTRQVHAELPRLAIQGKGNESTMT